MRSVYIFGAVFLAALFLVNLHLHAKQHELHLQPVTVIMLGDGDVESIPGSNPATEATNGKALPRHLAAGGPGSAVTIAAAGNGSSASSGAAAASSSPQPVPYKAVEEVRVLAMTGHFFGSDFEGPQPNCTLGTTVINCHYGTSSGATAQTADVLWYHIPSLGSTADLRWG